MQHSPSYANEILTLFNINLFSLQIDLQAQWLFALNWISKQYRNKILQDLLKLLFQENYISGLFHKIVT